MIIFSHVYRSLLLVCELYTFVSHVHSLLNFHEHFIGIVVFPDLQLYFTVSHQPERCEIVLLHFPGEVEYAFCMLIDIPVFFFATSLFYSVPHFLLVIENL